LRNKIYQKHIIKIINPLKVPELETNKPLILIVDDSPINISFCKKILNKNGYTTDSCKCGEEALEYLEKNSPDLILLDIVMPGIDGYEFCEYIKTCQK